MVPDQELLEALEPIWRLPRPAYQDLSSTPSFVRLRETCERLYPNAGGKMVLEIALRYGLTALGMPGGKQSGNEEAALSVQAAAVKLDAAFKKTHAARVHICPLDCADDLPELTFGSNVISKLSVNELEALVDQPRLRRFFAKHSFDVDSFSKFTWLVVRETVELDERVGARAFPVLFQDWGSDFGEIIPYRSTFPEAVETALTFLMLSPWEEWVEHADLEWRCFRIPWVYTIDDDLFARPETPPTSNTLSWQPAIYYDDFENEVDLGEQPIRWNINEEAIQHLAAWVNDSTWAEFKRATLSPLFSSPICHFLLRAYRSEGIDEFLANTTVVDAALGLHADHKTGRATKKLIDRLSVLLDCDAGNDYKRLFNTRSEFVHGRAMEAIPGKDRLLARSLARRTAGALVKRAHQASNRDSYLNELLEAHRSGN